MTGTLLSGTTTWTRLGLKNKRNGAKPDQEVYILGPSRAKEITGEFAHAFLRFLAEGGVNLLAGKDERTFVRYNGKNSPSTEKSSTDNLVR